MRLWRRAVTMLVFLGAVPAAWAQTPPPTAPVPPPPPPRWSGKGELSFVQTSGNADTLTVGTAADVLYQPGKYSAIAKFAFVKSKAEEVENAKSLAALLRAERALGARTQVYGQIGYLRNRFAGIDRRVPLEVGLAYRVLQTPAHVLRLEAGLGYTKETRLTGADLSFATAREGAAYKWTISKSAELTDEASVTENLQDGSDWRFGNAAAITASIARHFSLKVSHTFSYLNQPVAGFEKTDTVTGAAIVAKF
jgi:putative salt-induced outer membrane protein